MKTLKYFLKRIPFIRDSKAELFCSPNKVAPNFYLVDILGWSIGQDVFYGMYKYPGGLSVIRIQKDSSYKASRNKGIRKISIDPVRETPIIDNEDFDCLFIKADLVSVDEYLEHCEASIEHFIPYDVLDAQIQTSKKHINKVLEKFNILAQFCTDKHHNVITKRYSVGVSRTSMKNIRVFSILLEEKHSAKGLFQMFSPDYLYRVPQLIELYRPESQSKALLGGLDVFLHIMGVHHFEYVDIYNTTDFSSYLTPGVAEYMEKTTYMNDWRRLLLYRVLKYNTPSREPVLAVHPASAFDDPIFYVLSRYKNGRLHGSMITSGFNSRESSASKIASDFLNTYKSNVDTKYPGWWCVFDEKEDIDTILKECEMYKITGSL